MKLDYPFATDETPELGQVGGKAMSLILLTRRGLPVPPGFVLTVAFFQPWLERIQQTPEWTSVLNGAPKDLKQKCDALKALAMGFELGEGHEKVLAEALASLKTGGQTPLFAVRSSSPEEDLEGASFAGGYETVLGVKEDGVKDAVRRAFASCLDERVLVYKREHEFTVDRPRIAVIVQQQVAAQTAGVGFSLNPLNNCYDEAVINANFGLGESVVAGLVTPDSFVVDKVSRTVVERKVGKKETCLWLGPEGGTYQEPSPSRSQLCLSDAKVLALTDVLVQVEDYYQKPMDIEWAFVGEKLTLLQARPITAYIPLPEEMRTRPGERKVLYIDLTTYKQGINEPLSVMGLDFWEKIQVAVAGTDALLGVKDGLLFNLGGRTYSNLSHSLRLQSKKRVADGIRIQDAYSADIVENLDDADDTYASEKLPGRLKGALLKVALKRAGTVVAALRAFSRPAKQHRALLAATKDLVEDLDAIAAQQHSPKELAFRLTQRFGRYMAGVSLPVTVAAEMARARIKKLFGKEGSQVRDKIAYLERALPNNVTIEMGLAMYRLACFEEIKECSSADEFALRIERRAFSAEFLKAWDSFMQKYGLRCPLELDVASRRFYERPEEFTRQLRTVALNTDEVDNPQAVYERGVIERQEAYEFLVEAIRPKGKRKETKLEKYYQVLKTFGGYREIFKYYIVVIVEIFRKRVLSEAHSLVRAGRLDYPEQAFDLTIEDLNRALVDPSLDLRAVMAKNTRFLRKIRHVRNFPQVIDSRGKILRAPRKEAKEGELVGEPISAGKVRGKVKVLSRPDEKPVLPGEILVARATDPGWTPLFLNARGIVLEVGGVLQHGALVAREYCKPCVAGVENAASILQDGQEVELDGTNGIVRLV